MREFDLALVGATAERLRLQQLTNRMLRRGVFAAVALLFLLAAFVFAQLIAYQALRGSMTPMQAAALLLRLNLLAAVLLTLVAAWSRPGVVEREAMLVRQTAWTELRVSMSVAEITARLLRRVLDGVLSRR
jgi:hypothetical protein